MMEVFGEVCGGLIVEVEVLCELCEECIGICCFCDCDDCGSWNVGVSDC